MKSRGTTSAELGDVMNRLLASARGRVVDGWEPTFRCRGGCQDTGWVEVDDGLDENGKRVKAPTVTKCSQCGGQFTRRSPDDPRGGGFS